MSLLKKEDVNRLVHEEITLYNLILEKDKEIERLNNIINKLERHLEQQWLEWKDCETDVRFMANEDKCILEKLRELKGSGKE